MRGFITPGFSIAGQQNIQNDGGVIGPDNTPTVNDLVTSFTSSGTYGGASPLNAPQTGKVILVGGGGGGGRQAGGGGAGGVVIIDSAPLASPFPVSVGSGGSGAGDGQTAGSGGNTSAPIGGTTYTAQGGGRCGRSLPNYVGPSSTFNGGPGGSGGGGGRGNNNPGQACPGGSANQPGQSNPGANTNVGNAGGTGNNPQIQDNRIGGGGGGAGGAGSQSQAGAGIAAIPSSALPQSPIFSPGGTGKLGGGGGGGAGLANGGGAPNQYFTPFTGTDGAGGGGGSCYNFPNPGSAGGDGGVHVIETKAGPRQTSGVWTSKAVYSAVEDDNWVN
tara:strand:- start:6842 stop:7834 length:993 start_codon:yes stop_codon:yes gene_type:complete